MSLSFIFIIENEYKISCTPTTRKVCSGQIEALSNHNFGISNRTSPIHLNIVHHWFCLNIAHHPPILGNQYMSEPQKMPNNSLSTAKRFFFGEIFLYRLRNTVKDLVQCKQNFLGSTFPALCWGQMCTLMILLLLHCLALPCTDDQLCCTLGKCCTKGSLNCAHLNIEYWVQVLRRTKVCKFYASALHWGFNKMCSS